MSGAGLFVLERAKDTPSHFKGQAFVIINNLI